MTDSSAPDGGSPIPDGEYDAFIVDAEPDPTDDSRVVSVDITITAGEHKGATYTLGASGLQGTDIDLMGMPATLTVRDGHPSLELD